MQLRQQLQKSGINCDTAMPIIEQVSSNYDIHKNEVTITQADKQHAARLLCEYIRCRRGEGLSQKTLKLYSSRVKDFVINCNKPIEKVQRSDIQQYLFQYEDTHNVSRRTLQTYRIALLAFFKWASTEQLIEKNPMDGVRKIKYQRKPRKALTSDQMAQLKGSCCNAKELAIIETMYSTGCRIAELAKLKLQDTDIENGIVHLHGKGGKYRDSYLSPDAKWALKQYMKQRNDDCQYLICSTRGSHGVSTDQMRRDVHRIALRCDMGWVTPHILRHTFATRMLRNNVPVTDIQHIMGHASANTTMIYAEISQDNVKNGHIRCFG